jgi:hypothetical protein
MHTHKMAEGAFYARRANPAQSFFTLFRSRKPRWPAASCNARSSVGERLAETRLLTFQFAGLQYLPAIQALHVLRVLILGDQLRSFVLAGRFGC